MRAGSARAVERLRAAGQVYEQDGATWFRSTAYGDDKDRVIYRSDGRPTYFAADIGYVTEKFSRGFDHLIYIWGVDHHGTVARNKNAAQAMGYDPDHYQVLLIGWVRFVVDGVEVSMSKRAGTFVTLDDLLDAVGTDAARWFFASRAAHVEIDFDIELAKKQSAENPVYYVQYAHARIASILRKAAEAGLAPAAGVDGAARGRAGGGAGARASRGCPRSSRTRSSPRRRRASPPTRPSSRRSSTRSTGTRGSSIPQQPGAVRAAPRAGAGDQDDARQRAGPAGDLRARVDVGVIPRAAVGPRDPPRTYPDEAERPLDAAERVGGLRRDEHDAARRRAEDRAERPAALSFATWPARAVANSSASAARVPGRVEDDRDLAAGTLDEGDPVAAPARGRVGGARRAALLEEDLELELADACPASTPSSHRPGARPGRPGRRPRPAPRARRTCPAWSTCSVESGGLAYSASTPAYPPFCERAERDSAARCVYGNSSGSLRIAGIRSSDRLGGRDRSAPPTCAQLGRA